MFTGLIEAVGRVDSIRGGSEGLRIEILCPPVASGLALGDSINVDGVCQTVVAATQSTFSVEAVGDTLVKTTFRKLARGARVNLERALRADDRFGGHMVMGHVAGTARIISWKAGAGAKGTETGAWFLVLELDPSWEDRVVPEGSIAVDGISLTVAEVTRNAALSSTGSLHARASIIPHTRLATTLAERKAGDFVNIELDILASYVRAAMNASFGKGSGISLEKLSSWGYS
jgi:riboflavin synthase